MSGDEIKQERHKARQQKVKEQVDAKIAAAQEEKGLLLIITGNGKGKSTSGFGTIARAVGHGKQCAVAQFIKGTWENGERNLLEKLGVEFQVMSTGFTWKPRTATAIPQRRKKYGNTANACCRMNRWMWCCLMNSLTW